MTRTELGPRAQADSDPGAHLGLAPDLQTRPLTSKEGSEWPSVTRQMRCRARPGFAKCTGQLLG